MGLKYKIIFLLIIFSIFFSYYNFYLYSEPNISKKNLSIDEKSKLEKVGEIEVLHLYLSGYEAGFEHGKNFKKEIEELVKIAEKQVYSKYGPVFLVKMKMLHNAKKLESYIPEKYKQEMKGVADGAGVEYADILLFNTYDDLMYLSGCSSFAVSKNNKSEKLIHAKNLDYPLYFLAEKNIIIYNHKTKYISVGFPGFIGVQSGVNLNGITLTENTSKVKNNNFGFPATLLNRKILEEAKNITQALNILEENTRTIGINLTITDYKENKISVLETSSDRIINRKGKNYIVATNHFASGEIENDILSYGDSKIRYNYLNNIFDNVNKLNVNKIKNIMTYCNNKIVCIGKGSTLQSVIFVPEIREIFITEGLYDFDNNKRKNNIKYEKFHY